MTISDDRFLTTSSPSIVPVVGLFLLLLTLGLILLIAEFTDQQFFVIRVIIAIAGGASAAAIPGFLNVNMDTRGIAISAGEALAVFAIFYLWAPRVKFGEDNKKRR